MKRVVIKLQVLLGAMLLFPSCLTILFVEKPLALPPEIEIQGSGNLMVVQNYFDYTRTEFVQDNHKDIYHSAVTSFIGGLTSYLEGDNLITCIAGDTLVKNLPGGLPSDVINPDSVVAICYRYDADFLLSVDSLYIGFDWETEVIEDDESSYKVKSFYLEIQPFLSLYDNSGTLIDRSYVYQQELYKDRLALSGLITFKPSLAKAVEEISAISADAGSTYGSKFFPRAGRSDYMVYYSKPFDVSYYMMVNGEWGNAIRELLPLADSKDKKIARRAANNLYVAYMGIGDETSANLWYERATGKTLDK